MREKIYFITTFCLFVVVLTSHLLRLFYEAEIIFVGVELPMSISWWAVAVTGLLSLSGLHLYNKNK